MRQESLSDKAYHEIRQRIAMGILATEQQVSELSLSKEIGIGRTPVREAIRRLQQEGWVEQVPRFGTIVRQPSHPELIELFEVRDAIESFAAAQAAERIRTSDVDVLHKLCDRIDGSIKVLRKHPEEGLDPARTEDFLKDDMTFHTIIMGAAGNARMVRIFAETRALGRIASIRQQQPPDLGVLEMTHRDHSQIAAALAAKNPEESHKAMSGHIRNSRRIILEQFEKQSAYALSDSLGIPEEIRRLLQLDTAAVPPPRGKRRSRKAT